MSWDLEVALRQNQELLSDTTIRGTVLGMKDGPFFQDAPNIPEALNQEFGGLGRAVVCSRGILSLLTEYLLMSRYSGLPFAKRSFLKLPKVNGIAGSGCSSGKAGGDDWTYGGSFPGIMASKIWAEPDISEAWPVQKVTDWIRLFRLICSGSVDSIIFRYDVILGFVYIYMCV